VELPQNKSLLIKFQTIALNVLVKEKINTKEHWLNVLLITKAYQVI